MRVTALNLIVEKWRRNASNARPSYEEGIQNPRFPWANSASKAKQTYADAVQRAIELDLYSKGVQAAGDEKWRTRSLSLGAARYTAGIAASQSAYEMGFAPYRQVLEGLNLPPKYARGDERNIERVAVIARALHDKRMQLMGAA
jgi:hypothetical protein